MCLNKDRIPLKGLKMMEGKMDDWTFHGVQKSSGLDLLV